MKFEELTIPIVRDPKRMLELTESDSFSTYQGYCFDLFECTGIHCRDCILGSASKELRCTTLERLAKTKEFLAQCL